MSGTSQLPTSQWSKDVKKALIDRDMTMRELAEEIGYNAATISSVIRGRYPNATGVEIVKKINSILGTQGKPGRILTERWCESVRIAMLKKHVSVNDLAGEFGVTRDKVSLVINGRLWDGATIDKIVKTLGVDAPATPSAS